MVPVKVWYLHHSSFALQVADYFLIFDYFHDIPVPGKTGLNGGVIDPEAIKDLKVYVFSSHRHYDHFDPVIFNWRGRIRNLTYILSSDIRTAAAPDIHFLPPHEERQIDDLRIRTFQSNDEGVAYHIEVAGLRIFHSGDLNWWKWTGEDKAWIDGVEKIYFDEMDRLRPLPVDIAFLPVDPRLENNYALTLDYYASKVHPESILFPMHFNENWHYAAWLERDGHAVRTKVKLIRHRGEAFEF